MKPKSFLKVVVTETLLGVS